MLELDLLKIEEKVKQHLDASDDIELCPFVLKLNNELYYYGSVDQNGCFIVNKDGEWLSKRESTSVFKRFLQAEIILGDNLEHFQQSSNRPITIFNQLSIRLKKFHERYGSVYNNATEIIETITHMLDVIKDEQNNLIDSYKELEEIKAKIQSSNILTDNDVNKIVSLNSTLNFSLYNQAKIIQETTESINLFNKLLKEQLSFSQKYSPNVVAIRLILKQFTSKAMIENNRNQLESFEVTATGEHISIEKGNSGLYLLHENLNNKFEDTFRNNYINYLLN